MLKAPIKALTRAVRQVMGAVHQVMGAVHKGEASDAVCTAFVFRAVQINGDKDSS